MRITNPYNLPEAYVRAVSQQRVPVPNQISVTELLQPPMMRALWLNHHEEVEQIAGVDDHDVFHGNAVHAYLEKFAGATTLAEKLLEYEIEGWRITGTPDSIEWLGLNDTLLIDWKTTRVRALKYDKAEWAAQANMYVHLARLNGVSINAIDVYVFLKDFDRNLLNDPEYPRAHLCKIPVPVWATVRAHDFLLTRLRLHQAAVAGVYNVCSDEERWIRRSWAVQKIDGARATKAGLPSKDAAREYAEALVKPLQHWADWYDLREDVTEPLRCKSWCKVSAFCPTWQAELAEGAVFSA